MKNLNRIAQFFGVALLLASTAFAQTVLTQTTLSSNVISTAQTVLTVTSATGITANNTMLYILDGTASGEAVFVNAVNGNSISVTRGYFGTLAYIHASGALVFAGPPFLFYSTDPSGLAPVGPTGTASCSNALVTPWINIAAGRQWLCSTVTTTWVPGFFNDYTTAGVTTAVASVAGPTTPSGPLFHVTGTNAITAWGPTTTTGALGMGGGTSNTVGAPFCVIPDAIFTVTATNNVALASTAVVNKLLCYVFDQTNKKYVPSY